MLQITFTWVSRNLRGRNAYTRHVLKPKPLSATGGSVCGADGLELNPSRLMLLSGHKQAYALLAPINCLSQVQGAEWAQAV